MADFESHSTVQLRNSSDAKLLGLEAGTTYVVREVAVVRDSAGQDIPVFRLFGVLEEFSTAYFVPAVKPQE